MKYKKYWNSNTKISKNNFKCAYCGKTRRGPYRWVDGEKSCELCNRRYDPPCEVIKIKCPTCEGRGYFEDRSAYNFRKKGE